VVHRAPLAVVLAFAPAWADNNNQPAAASLAQNNFRVLRSPSAPPPPGGPIFCAEMYPELNTFLWRVSARLRLQPGFGWSSFGPGSRFPQIWGGHSSSGLTSCSAEIPARLWMVRFVPGFRFLECEPGRRFTALPPVEEKSFSGDGSDLMHPPRFWVGLVIG